MPTSRTAVASPACAARPRRRGDAPGHAGTARFPTRCGHGRRGRGAAPAPRSASAHAAGPGAAIGCLEAEPWGAVAPAPALHVAAPAPGDALAVPSEQRVREVVLKQAALAAAAPRTARIEPEPVSGALKAAFDRCGEVCNEYAKTFYLGKRHRNSLLLFLFIRIQFCKKKKRMFCRLYMCVFFCKTFKLSKRVFALKRAMQMMKIPVTFLLGTLTLADYPDPSNFR